MTTPPTIYCDYFKITNEYINKYGPKTVLLYQVGSFFEVYATKHAMTGELHRSNIEEFGQICQLNISEKKVKYETENVYMAGFRDYSLEKYIQRLSENGYTSVIYVQEKGDTTVTRVFHSVQSPGTFMSFDTESAIDNSKITNHVMSIWIQKYKNIRDKKEMLVYGISTVNIFTGQSFIFEKTVSYYINPSTFDELEKFVHIYQPSEVIIISDLSRKETQMILQYSGVQSSLIHSIFLEEYEEDHNISPTSPVLVDLTKKCSTQVYIVHMLSVFFGNESFQICKEFSEYSIATNAFIYLLNFIQEHNPNLTKKIAVPQFANVSTNVVLANHTLAQLNIIDSKTENRQSGHLSSVLTFLNQCKTAMGKRLLKQQMTVPTFDEKWLETEYKYIQQGIVHIEKIQLLQKSLFTIFDLEKWNRQLLIQKLYPSSIFQLHMALLSIKEMTESDIISSSLNLYDYLCDNYTDISVIERIKTIIKYIETTMNVEKCRMLNSITTFETNPFQIGFSQTLDNIDQEYRQQYHSLNRIRDYFTQLLRTDSTTMDDMTEYVKIHQTEKSGLSLQLTKKRAKTLKDILSSKTSQISETIQIANTETPLNIIFKDVQFSNASTSNMEITFPLLDQICKRIFILENQLSEEIQKTFFVFLKQFENNYYNDIGIISKYVAKMDVWANKTFIAEKYHYCRPVIQSDASKSFINASKLRHVLIEHLQQNEVYVANSLQIGDNMDGMLLYGTNAVGKTSFIRAIGIAVIMAQSGMFVPCAEFTYKPYCSIFSRILGNDNLFKGLSTFVVEMSELRTILKMADENSLILGDELCSGTETESALSIFTAGLMNLDKKRSTYLFATHFHEILDYAEIKAMKRLMVKHMAVSYHPELDCLVYDRILTDGAGTRMYGLEVCKSLYLDKEFLDMAFYIRNRYHTGSRGELYHKQSLYNSKKIRGMCEMCGSVTGDEIHHIQPQKNADDTGYIGDQFHKNHGGNLMSLCESCHTIIHENMDMNNEKEGGFIRKKTTAGYKVMNV
jgi:DNA mismatch repair protein MutS